MKSISFITTLLLCVNLFGQREISKKNLPEVVKNDVIEVKGEVWIETVDSEINQRANISFLKRKIDKIHETLKDKQNIKHNIDSLFFTITSLQHQRDSLNKVIEESQKEIVQDCTNRVSFLNTQLKEVRNQYFIQRDKLKDVRKKNRLLVLVAIAEGVIIILLV